MIKALKLVGRHLLYAEAWAFGIFLFLGVFTPGAMSLNPDYGRGRTFYIHVAGRGGGLRGYTKPWVGYTYDTVAAVTFLLLALLVIWAVVYFSVVPRDQWRLISPRDKS